MLSLLEGAEISYTPSVVLAEISRRYSERGFSEDDIRGRIESVLVLTRILYVNESMALQIPKAWKEIYEKAGRPPTLMEAILLSSARSVGGKLVTGEKALKGLPEVIYIWERSRKGGSLDLIACQGPSPSLQPPGRRSKILPGSRARRLRNF